MVYLSRADRFAANLEEATSAPASLDLAGAVSVTISLKQQFDRTTYLNDSDEIPVTGAKNGMKLADMRGVSYDDLRWEALLDQLTVDEMAGMIAMSGYQTPAIESWWKDRNTGF